MVGVEQHVHDALPVGRVALAAAQRTVPPPHPARADGGFPLGVDDDLLRADLNGIHPSGPQATLPSAGSVLYASRSRAQLISPRS
ncbi:MAG: hypothetical protein QOF00_6360 [Pseudonocardiales bacterium]|nr:hypothetical protein [Pseudonocardiales bacterium]